jgi:RHS repeat-associated protein
MRKRLGVLLGLVIGISFLQLEVTDSSSGDRSSWRVTPVSRAVAGPSNTCSPCQTDCAGAQGACDAFGGTWVCMGNNTGVCFANNNYPQQVNQQKNQGDPENNSAGDPINFAIGSLYDAETDYRSLGAFPLVLTRYYNSADTTGVHKFGAKWRGSYGRSLVQTSSTVATATRDDGKVLTFTLTSGVWTPDPDVNFRLTKTGSGWSLVTDQDETETYDANGHLTTYANRGGQLTQTFGRDAQGRLVTVTDPFGRTLTFAFASPTSPLVTQMTAPDGGVYSYGYDGSSRLTSVTYPDASQRQFVYENASFPTDLTGIIDENGNRYATFAYDSSGRATSSQYAGGAGLTTVDYTNFMFGQVDVTGPLGGVTTYALEAINGSAKQDVVQRTCSNCFYVGGSITNSFDANGNLTSTTDFNGNQTTFAYDTTRNLETSRTLAAGTSIARTITTSWNANFRLPAQIVDGSRTITNSYDSHGNLLSSTLTAPTITSTRSFAYNSNGQVLTATDPRGNVTTYTYDASGNTTSMTNALGQATLYTGYDANGRLLSMTDPNGVVTTFTYNFRGQLTSKTALARVTTYAYDAVGNLTKLTRPDGSFLAMTYDAAHRLVGVADALGNTIAYTLDAASNRTQTQLFDSSHTLRQTHSRVFDGFSRLYQDIGAANQASTFFYDDNDNLNVVDNPIGIRTSNTFDALNRLTQSVADSNSLAATTMFGYDLKGRLNQATDPRSLATNYTYDGLDDRTTTASPDAGTMSNTYDAAGNLVTSQDANGNTSTYTYDALNRVTKRTQSNGSAISYQYDQGTNGIGRLTGMTDPTGTTTWAYNRYGQVNLRQNTIGTAPPLTTHWVYTSNTGLLASITYPSGATVSFAYDADGRANAISYQPSGGATSALLSQIAYQPFGPVTSWQNGNGTTYSRSYDQDGRVNGLALPAGVAIAITYDANNRVTGMTETGLPAQSFSYDSLDRLTGYTAGSLSQTYGYDVAGNRTSFTSNSPSLSLTYQYASTSNRLLGVSGGSTESYGYDANGNITNHVTAGATYQFAYNARNRQNQSTVGTSTKAYQIDGLGQRVAKLDTGMYQTLFSFDASGHMMGLYNGNGSLIEETVWLRGMPVAVLVPGAALFVAPDYLGAPHQITDSGGNVVWFWFHDPFGNGLPTGSFNYNLRFPGQFYDQQTGLHYNYFRDYDPAKGRYLESDPVGLSGGTNTYAYVANGPTYDTDRLGLCPSAKRAGDDDDIFAKIEKIKRRVEETKRGNDSNRGDERGKGDDGGTPTPKKPRKPIPPKPRSSFPWDVNDSLHTNRNPDLNDELRSHGLPGSLGKNMDLSGFAKVEPSWVERHPYLTTGGVIIVGGTIIYLSAGTATPLVVGEAGAAGTVGVVGAEGTVGVVGAEGVTAAAGEQPLVEAACQVRSDARLKRDIIPVGRLENGLNLYRYRYLWSDQLYVGVMAQEVAEVVPDAVVTGPDGYLRVDYGRLGIRLRTWEEWQSATSSESGSHENGRRAAAE